MATLDIPSGGLSLRGWPLQPYKPSAKQSTLKRSAILLRINKQVIRELQQCAKSGEAVRLLSGQAPKIKYGSKSIDLQVESEAFTHELYTQNSDDNGTLDFTAAVTQRASVSILEKAQNDTAGADAALNNLKQSLASHAQDKESKQATISSTVIPSTKSNRVLSNRYATAGSRGASQGGSPLPSSALLPTSAPMLDPVVIAQNKAMTFAISHLLSSRPLHDDVIASRTHIPQPKRLEMLQKLAEEDRVSKKWTLKDRAYKDLDIHKFKYPNEEDQEAAIDNAIRAFDRTRLSKDDKLWQMLLPEHDRGKGKCLSRLHNNIHLATTKEKPNLLGASSPLAVSDNEAAATNMGRLTPQTGSTPMARTSSATAGKGMSIEKRLKESQKQRAAEEAKEAKRKVKEMKPASIMNTDKPRATNARHSTKASASKIKSEATVHSSDDESDGEMKKLSSTKQKSSILTNGTDARSPPGNSSSEGKPLAARLVGARKPAQKPLASPNAVPKRNAVQQGLGINGNATPTPASNSAKLNSDSRKPTPSQRAEKRPPAPAGASPDKVSPDLKSKTPSPLGRGTNGTPGMFGSYDRPQHLVKKVVPAAPSKGHKPNTSVSSTGRPVEAKKRPASTTITSDTEQRPRKALKPNLAQKAPATSTAATGTAALKRKAAPAPSEPATKHRRTESSSTQSLLSSSSTTTTARTSISSPSPFARSPSVASSVGKSDWERALEEAERFRTTLYPQYQALYDRIKGMKADEVRREDTERLWKMHERLKGMKRDIRSVAKA